LADGTLRRRQRCECDQEGENVAELSEKGADWPKIGAFEVRIQSLTSSVKSSEFVVVESTRLELWESAVSEKKICFGRVECMEGARDLIESTEETEREWGIHQDPQDGTLEEAERRYMI
jgi:hypothetical protein